MPIRKVVATSLEMHALLVATEPWCGYLADDGPSHDVVGTCAFKSPPTAGGVEIA